VSLDARAPSNFLARPGALVVAILTAATFVVPLITLYAGLSDLHGGWDDGAITMAFARTLSHDGRFALTPISPIVEGSSSLLWTWILSLSYHWLSSVDAMMATAKVFSAAAFVGLLVATRRLASIFLSPSMALVATLLVALSRAGYSETINGMEMNLYALLAVTLALVLLRESESRTDLALACVLSVAILLVRFESLLLLVALYASIALQQRQKRRSIVSVMVMTAVAFVAIELARRHFFGAWVPNTILAKRWYAFEGFTFRQRVRFRVDAMLELLSSLAVPGGAVLLLATTHAHPLQQLRVAGGVLRRAALPLLLMSLAAVVQSLLIGRNWGQEGRMTLAFLPFMVIALSILLDALLKNYRIHAAPVLVLLVAVGIYQWTRAPYTSLNPFAYRWSEPAALDAEELRKALHLPTASFLTPDVGAPGLCCENLNVLDFALLTNPRLARTGYSDMPGFFRDERPDIVQSKQPWSSVGDVYRLGLLEPYFPVEIGGAVFFVRKDHVDAANLTAVPCASLPQPPWWNAADSDMKYARQQARCFQIAQPGK
jgi:hypothetical protein